MARQWPWLALVRDGRQEGVGRSPAELRGSGVVSLGAAGDGKAEDVLAALAGLVIGVPEIVQDVGRIGQKPPGEDPRGCI